VGRYDLRIGVNVVTREGNHLFAQLSTSQNFEIFPLSEMEFFYPGGSERLTFEKDNTGKVLKAIFRRGDFSLDGPRMEDMVETKVDPAGYDLLVGQYGLHQGQIMTVTRQESRLFAQMTSGMTLEIFPRSELEFFWKELNAHV